MRTLDFLEAPTPGDVLGEGDAPAMGAPRKYSDELRERAVRLVFESGRPIAHVARCRRSPGRGGAARDPLDRAATRSARATPEGGAVSGAARDRARRHFRNGTDTPTGVSGPAVSQLLAGLAEAGLLERNPLAGDRRRQTLLLSAAGEQAYRSANALLRQRLAALLTDLPRPEADALSRVLPRVESILSGAPPRRPPPPPAPGKPPPPHRHP